MISVQATRTAALCAVAAAVLLAAGGSTAEALPVYARFYQQRYEYRPSCNACHESGGGSALNAYGRDFVRAGADLFALEDIEADDSDGDGAANADEVAARANPGHPASRPDAPGPWLDHATRPPLPREWLERIFPESERFSAYEADLSPEERDAIEEDLDDQLADEDMVPSFYFAWVTPDGADKPRKSGIAFFVYLPGADGMVVLGVGTDTRAVIRRVVLLKHGGHRTLADPAFRACFEGLSLDAEWDTSEDGNIPPHEDDPEACTAAARAIRRSLATLTAVFSRKKE